jgi:hypothetical protein
MGKCRASMDFPATMDWLGTYSWVVREGRVVEWYMYAGSRGEGSGTRWRWLVK